jgi:dCMP deaminase
MALRTISRPSWDEYFLTLAFEVSKRSTCLRRAVGAVLVKDRRILATGYNGVPSGLRHCEETGCLREQLGVPSGMRHEICRGLHAEQNAIIQAARYGIDIEGSSIYITTEPCSVCSKMIINAGITEIVFAQAYPDHLAEELLGETDIIVRSVPFDPGQIDHPAARVPAPAPQDAPTATASVPDARPAMDAASAPDARPAVDAAPAPDTAPALDTAPSRNASR